MAFADAASLKIDGSQEVDQRCAAIPSRARSRREIGIGRVLFALCWSCAGKVRWILCVKFLPPKYFFASHPYSFFTRRQIQAGSGNEAQMHFSGFCEVRLRFIIDFFKVLLVELCWRCSVEFQEDLADLINWPEDGCLLPVRGAPTKTRGNRATVWYGYWWWFGMKFFRIEGGPNLYKDFIWKLLFPCVRPDQLQLGLGCSRPSEWVGRAGNPCQWFHGNWFCCWGMEGLMILANYGSWVRCICIRILNS